MDINELRLRIESIADTAGLFLIDTLSENAGFFANDRKLFYVARDKYDYDYEGIETDYLKLQTHVRINSIKNNQTFKDGYYNIIIYKNDLNDLNIESFVQLCTIHAKNEDELNFKDFFYSLIALFQLPTSETFKNAIGLYGELKFIEYANKHFVSDISASWHKTGPFSQYDFSNGKENIEVKTTISNNLDVTIKHDQIFGEHPCYLAIVECEQYENGETLEELVSSMYSKPDAFNSVSFSINLAKELKRVSKDKVKELRFSVKRVLMFNAEDINPFPSLSEYVSQLNYKFNVSEFASLPTLSLGPIFKKFE